MLHQAGCQTHLWYRLFTKFAAPGAAGPGWHPRVTVSSQAASKAAGLAEMLGDCSLGGSLNSVHTVLLSDTPSLFQLIMCFQNLDQVYWPLLKSGMRQLIPNPVVITLSMWTSPAGMMGSEKSWKCLCKTKVSEWIVLVFFGFIEISYGGEILKYFNVCLGTGYASQGSSLSWTCIFTCCCVKWT